MKNRLALLSICVVAFAGTGYLNVASSQIRTPVTADEVRAQTIENEMSIRAMQSQIRAIQKDIDEGARVSAATGVTLAIAASQMADIRSLLAWGLGFIITAAVGFGCFLVRYFLDRDRMMNQRGSSKRTRSTDKEED